MDFKTTPAIPEVMPFVPSNNSRFFNKNRVATLADLKEGRYIRVWWQPLFANGHMMSIEDVRVAGRPYRYKDKESANHNSWKIKKQLTWSEEVRELKFNHANPGIRELGRSHYVSSLGIGQRRYAYHTSQCYRFSNKMLSELKRIQAMGDFASFCWFHNMPACEASYLEFACRVMSEREEERAFDRMMMDCWIDDYYHEDAEDDDRHDLDAYHDAIDAGLKREQEFDSDGVESITEDFCSSSSEGPGPYDHLENMKFAGRKGLV